MAAVLPIGISVPHAGLGVPAALRPFCKLSEAEIAADGDVGARAIYDVRDEFAAFARTDVARAVLDMNRSEDDRRKDGVFKTHTCWDVPIWDPTPGEDRVEQLFVEHYRPYHARLSAFAQQDGIVLALDCHTMAAFGPPVGPDPGVERPLVCIGDGRGTACPRDWVERMQVCMARHFPGLVTINEPFAGGHITRSHGKEMPWMQVEISRSDDFGEADKQRAFLASVRDWCSARG